MFVFPFGGQPSSTHSLQVPSMEDAGRRHDASDKVVIVCERPFRAAHIILTSFPPHSPARPPEAPPRLTLSPLPHFLLPRLPRFLRCNKYPVACARTSELRSCGQVKDRRAIECSLTLSLRRSPLKARQHYVPGGGRGTKWDV